MHEYYFTKKYRIFEEVSYLRDRAIVRSILKRARSDGQYGDGLSLRLIKSHSRELIVNLTSDQDCSGLDLLVELELALGKPKFVKNERVSVFPVIDVEKARSTLVGVKRPSRD